VAALFRLPAMRLYETGAQWVRRQWHSLQEKDAGRQLRSAHARRILESPWFDAEWYRTFYPDVARSGVEPAMHYLLHGAREGRDPGPAFSVAGYLARHPDVAASGVNPLLHYLEVGAAEGRALGPRERTRAAPRVVCISPETSSAGHAYRVLNMVSALREAGAEAAWMTLADTADRWQEVAAAEAVFLWRARWDDRVAAVVRAARGSGAVVVFDADDLVIEPGLACSDAIDGIRTQGLSTQDVEAYYAGCLRTFEAADWGCCSTDEIAGAMRRRGAPAFVVPNGFDRAAHGAARAIVRARRDTSPDGRLRIGYAAGTPTHQRDFAAAAEAVATVLRERPSCRLVLFRDPVSGRRMLDPAEFASLRGLEDQVEWRDLVPPAELSGEVARFDVNLAPVEVGNPFCEAKSELKFFEAALVEVCTVASPAGPFRRAIRHGETGLLADDPRSWTAALRGLLDDPARRARLGRAAYRDAAWAHGPHRRAELLGSLLDQALGDSRNAARAFALGIRRDCARPALRLPVPEPETRFEWDAGAASEVTVVVPLFNYGRYVAEALESVRAQTLGDLDLVVIDDASTDDSLEVALGWLTANARRFNRAALLANGVNSGLGPTRNAGVDRADTPFVLPLDADNRLLPEACRELLSAVRDGGAAFAYPICRQFGAGDGLLGKVPYAPQRLVGGNYIDAMALMRKECWTAVGGYSDIHDGLEDFDLWCRIAERGGWGCQVPRVLAEYRLHEASMQERVTKAPGRSADILAALRRRHPWLSPVGD
jgi:glycosyltransferase involved in cell wall biosynthesis/GT2 family glycosyltransferase